MPKASSSNERLQSGKSTTRGGRRARRLKRIATAFTAIGLIAAVGSALSAPQKSIVEAPDLTLGPKNMATGGLAFHGIDRRAEPIPTEAVSSKSIPKAAMAGSTGNPRVVIYVDWSCPDCRKFLEEFSAELLNIVSKGEMRLEIRPVALLDAKFASGSRYSSRVANAAACVAGYVPDGFLCAQSALLNRQPPLGGKGLSDVEILGVINDVGLYDKEMMLCVQKESYASWVTAATTQAVAAAQGPSFDDPPAPVVLVDEVRLQGPATVLDRLDL